MILELVESDKPKSFGEKISEYLSSPPKPVLRFYGEFKEELAQDKRHILFTVRNGLPLPLLYGIYVKVNYDSMTDYTDMTDHIGPFSKDDWRLTLDNLLLSNIEIKVGLVPFEIRTDMVGIRVG